jgi:glycosyltransferase involved in cell wall biosynthesis
LCRSDLKRAIEVLGRSDVLHIHEIWDPAALQLARRARRMGLAVVVSPHGSLGTHAMRHKRLKKLLYLRLGGKRMLERASAVHCLTEPEAEQSRRWCPRARIRVLPLLMDLSVYEHDPGAGGASRIVADLDPDLPNLLFLGRVDPRKGPDQLIDAAIRLHDRGIHCNVVIAGKGEASYMASLRERAAAGGIARLVHFPGFVVGDEKIALFHWADLFVLPTHHEVWGIALHEALAAGTPVVTTSMIEVRDGLAATGAAEMVNGNADSLAAALAGLLRDRPALARRGAVAATRILDTHRPDAVGDRYIGFYQGLSAPSHVVDSGPA